MATYKPLQSVTLTSASSSVVLSGIDQNYTDLVLTITYAISNSAGSDTRFQLNGNTSSIYSSTLLAGKNPQTPNVASTRRNGVSYFQLHNWVTPIDSFVNTCTLQFFDYSTTNKNKTILSKSQTIQGTSYQEVLVQSHLFGSTSAITSINLYTSTYAFAAGTTINLYGIKSGAPSALGGDVVATDGTYWYHAFKSTGSFTPLKTLTADVLVVAGGGGGGGTGNGAAGGGGAGGLRLLTSQSLSGVQHTVTVGAGGTAGGNVAPYHGTNGGNSSIIGGATSVSATGGGAGGANSGSTNLSGQNGGSGGGGGAGYAGGSGNAGSYSPVEGYAGGNASTTPNNAAGGGGAGGAAPTPSSTRSVGGGYGGVGAGGVSYTNYAVLNAMGAATSTGVLSSSNYYYAGGGGGSGYYDGPGGLGGTGGGATGAGGNGSTNIAPGSATVNTGGGGGGGGTYNGLGTVYGGSNGASGIVIVRYPV